MTDYLAGKPRIELLATDIDGVLTDGGMYYGPTGQALKRFDVKDGLGLARLRDSGVVVVFISADSSVIGQVRGKKLRVREVHVGVADKAACLRDVLDRYQVAAAAAVYVGDDLPDLVVADLVGTLVAPADAVEAVKAVAQGVTAAPGGRGAMREICDEIIRHNEALESGG
jgi:3-deoxy-D-manno-octulosonate 8-phosphate phosphatase (KDO 8-P phosphatase)